jgi:hypothetical protein
MSHKCSVQVGLFWEITVSIVSMHHMWACTQKNVNHTSSRSKAWVSIRAKGSFENEGGKVDHEAGERPGNWRGAEEDSK